MNRKYLWLALVGVAAIAGMLAFTPRTAWLQTGLAFGAVLLFVAASMVPAVRRAALEHKLATQIVGGIVMALAVGVLMVGLFVAQVGPELTAGGFTALMLLGLMLFQLPRMAANMETATAEQKALVGVRPTPGGFVPMEEAKAAVTAITSRPAVFARIAGPWFLAFCAPPLIFADFDFWKGLLEKHPQWAVWSVLVMLLVVLTEAILLMIAAIQWTQVVAGQRDTRWSPGKALWRWSWRLLISGNVLLVVSSQFEGWLKAHLPGLTAWELQGVEQLSLFLFLVLIGPTALSLPAMVLSASRQTFTARLRGYRAAGQGFYIGMAAILAPYFALSWLLDLTTTRYPAQAVQAVCGLVGVLALFFTAMVAITYLTRVYLKGEALAATATTS